MTDGKDTLIRRQMTVRQGDWDRMQSIAKSAKYPTNRASIMPAIIRMGCDTAEAELKGGE